MPVSDSYDPAPIHTRLGDRFYDAVAPAEFPRRILRFRNDRWAAQVGLSSLDDAEWERHFARFEPLTDNLSEPLALRYHGHQFDVYNPALGDGRGFLFAQVRARDGRVLDLGTKGSGRTPYSRGGDGRLTLKGGVREILATEMLEALGVTTSKSFSLFETGEALVRGDEPSPTRSSVLVRLSHSHVRLGTFQRLAYEGAGEAIRALVEHCAEHYLPAIAGHDDLPAMLLREVCRRSAVLTGQWLAAGFVHGVLNSDNMVVTGESFDYGPYRFLPRYDPDFVAAYFDHGGLYAFGRQPRAVFNNLRRLAQTLRGLTTDAALERGLDGFMEWLRVARIDAVLRRLGVAARGPDEDQRLAEGVLDFLGASQMSVERFYFDWCGGSASVERALAGPARTDYEASTFSALRRLLDEYSPANGARLDHAYFASPGPASLVIDAVEGIWEAIDARDDWAPLHAAVARMRQMGEATGLGGPTVG